MKFARAWLLVVASVAVSAEIKAATVSFHGLGYLPGGDVESWAHGVSADGSVVVGWSRNVIGFNEAFLWTSASGMQGLGSLGMMPNSSNAYGVSADGTVVVGEANGQAFRWTQVDGMSAYRNGLAAAVSPDGTVAVGYTASLSVVGFEAARWSPALTRLGDLPGGDFSSFAFEVSTGGDVVVGIGNVADGMSQAFKWEAGAMTGLGYLPGGAGLSSANDVTPDGRIIVGVSNVAAGREAFRWTADEGMVGLGDLSGGDHYSEATAVSADGSVVVGYGRHSSGFDEAFIWDAVNGMRDLRELLVMNGADLTGWQNLHVVDISADGQTVVGLGHHANGSREAWIATVPEPATGTIGAIAAAFFWLTKRRHRRVNR